MEYYGHIDGKTNQLIDRVLEVLNSEPGLTEARFFYNDNDDRLEIGTGSGYMKVAYLNDLYGVSNWKKSARVATTSSSDTSSYTYTPANEPNGDVWTGVSSAPTIDGITLSDGDRVLIKDATDKRGNGVFYYDASNSSFRRTTDADNTPSNGEVASSMVPVEEGTTNAGTIWREIHSSTITLGTDDIEYTQFIINVPQEDKFVKITATDTTEKYLDDALDNPNCNANALNNLNNIQYVVQNSGANENVRFGLDLSLYTGDVHITGNTTIDGTSYLNDVTYQSGNTITYNNTTQTGDTNFDSNYTADYNNSTINYNSNFTLLGCDNGQAIPADIAINASATKVDVTVDYKGESETKSLTAQSGLIQFNVDGGTFTVEWNTTSGNIEVREINGDGSGTTDICQYSGGVTINNNGAITNNNDTIENNTNVTENYDGDSVINYYETEVNNTNVTENYYSDYTLIGCDNGQSLPYNKTLDSSTTKVEIHVDYDNSANDASDIWNKDVTVVAGANIIVSDAGHTGEMKVVWDKDTNVIDITKESGDGTFTVDVCEYTGGSIINNYGTINNNYNTTEYNENNTVVNENTEEYNTNVNNYYDENSTIVNEGDTYNNNLTVQNINYASTFVAGEDLSNRQPVRMGVGSLGEDTAKVYGANATDSDHSGFIGFTNSAVSSGDDVVVLQGPRVTGLKAVYGALTDGSDYYLQDDGTIGLAAGTVSVLLGTADGDDALVGLNVPLPESALVPPKQMKVNNTPSVGDVLKFVDDDTFEWGLGGGSGGVGIAPKEDSLSDSGTNIPLTGGNPIGLDLGILVFKTDSGLYWDRVTDWSYDSINNEVNLVTPLTSGERVVVKYWVYEGTAPTNYTTQEITTNSSTLSYGTFNLVTYNSGDVTLTLPDATAGDGKVIRVKKFTGNDTYNVIINPQSGQTIDGNTGVTFNIDKNQYAFIAVNGNRYIY